MKRSILSFSIFILVFANLILPLSVKAQEINLTTSVPSKHTLHLNIAGKGTVTVNGIEQPKSKDIPIQRHSEPSVQIQAARDYYIKSVTYNGERITHLFNSGKWSMPRVESDVTLSVVFMKDSGNPPTGDVTNFPLLMVMLLLSLLGIVTLIPYWHKHHLHL